MSKLRLTIASLLSLVSLSFFAVPALAADCTSSAGSAIQCGVNDVSGTNNPTPGQATSDLNDTITTIINIASAVVGVIAVIMIIVAGMRYVTSGGKQDAVTSAKNTILYAIIGLVIVALAQIIVHFVINSTVSPTPPSKGPSASASGSSGSTAKSSASGSGSTSGSSTSSTGTPQSGKAIAQ